MYGVHFWSLCVEEQFYLVFPLLFFCLRPGRTRLYWLLALWGACIGFRFLCAAFVPKAAYGLIPLVCGEYLVAGAVGAVVFAGTSGAAERLRAAARQWMFPVGLALGWRHALGVNRGVSLYVTPSYLFLTGGTDNAGLFRTAVGVDLGVAKAVGLTGGVEFGASHTRTEGGPTGTLYGLGISYAFGRR